MTNASAVANVGTGLGPQFVPTSTEIKADRHPLVESKYEAAVQRLGQDKYVENIDLFHFSTDVDHVMQDSPVEFVENSKIMKVKGRLRQHVKFWQSIGTSQFILDTISRGYIIPFLSTPASAQFPNNKSSLEHADFVKVAIGELVEASLAVECEEAPTVVNPLSVSIQSSGKKRLILDLRYPNELLKKFKVKFEDSRSMLCLLRECPQNWLFSFDIKSGYHHIDIFPDDQQYLGFSWVFDGVLKYFKFTVLPFGLASGPYIFTKIMRPLVKHWRSQAFKIVVYLDDGLGVAPCFLSCMSQAQSVKSDLIQSGFVPNQEKSVWHPVRCTKWLGFMWNLERKTLSVPEEKVARLLAQIDAVLIAKKVSARQLASVTGLIISNLLVFGNICKLTTKSLHRKIDSRASWDNAMIVDADSIRELCFWQRAASKLNSKSLVFKRRMPSRVIYSDASNTGCAAFVSMNGRPLCHKNWNEIELNQSSTWRELKCVQYALESFKLLLSDSTVKWFTDNQAVLSIVESGSMKLHLHKLALDIFECVKEQNMNLEVEWIPRTLNEQADYLSKIIDFEDWKVKDIYFRSVESHWGSLTIDCFASSENHKLQRYYSRFFSPGSLGVDCLAYSWHGEFCWLVPPISLIPRTIKHVQLCQCRGVLVVPVWPSSVFWPFLIHKDGTFQQYIRDCLYVENGKHVFEHGANKESLFGSEKLNSAVLFLYIDGSCSD